MAHGRLDSSARAHASSLPRPREPHLPRIAARRRPRPGQHPAGESDHAQNGQPGKWPSAVRPRAIARASVMAWQGQRGASLRGRPVPAPNLARLAFMRRAVRVVRVRGISWLSTFYDRPRSRVILPIMARWDSISWSLRRA